MRSYFVFLILIAFSLSTYAQKIERKSLNVTVYNENLGVIKDTREMEIQQGISTIKITDVSELIDPTTVHFKLDGDVLEQNYQYDLANMSKIISKYIDKMITLIDDKGNKITGKLISGSTNNIVLRKDDGGLIMLPNLDNYRLSVDALPEGLITVPTLLCKVNSNQSAKQPIELSYQTAGMAWHAEYISVINDNDTKMDFNSWVSVQNTSGTSYPNANLKLVAGDINRAKEIDRYAMPLMKNVQLEAQSNFQEKAFFEYHIYHLQRPTTLANNETKQISLFEASNINIQKKYYYKAANFRTDQGPSNVAVVVEFENTKGNNLGMPMPKGKVRLYKSDGKNLEFIGEDFIDHTPKNETIKLKVGKAFDVLVDDNASMRKKISDKVEEITYEYKIHNRKDEDIVVYVEMPFWGYWEVLDANHKYNRKNANAAEFTVPVKKDSEEILRVVVRITY